MDEWFFLLQIHFMCPLFDDIGTRFSLTIHLPTYRPIFSDANMRIARLLVRFKARVVYLMFHSSLDLYFNATVLLPSVFDDRPESAVFCNIYAS